MLIEFQEIQYQPDEYEKHVNLQLNSEFEGDYFSYRTIDISEVYNNFSRILKKYNGELTECTEVTLHSGTQLILCIDYEKFKKLHTLCTRIFTLDEALKLI